MPCVICGKQAHYGLQPYNGDKGEATHCVKCNNLGLVNVVANACIVCRKKSHYGIRSTNGTKKHPTHCSKCNKDLKLGLVNVTVKLCDFKDGTGKMCNSQRKKTIEGRNLCGEHSKGIEGGQRANECKEEGCTNSAIIEGYCRTHAKEHDIKTKDMCVDCTDKRGTYNLPNGKFICKPCKDNRERGDPSIKDTFKNINRTCDGEGCDKRASFAPTKDDPPRRCIECCKGMNWVCVTNKNYVLLSQTDLTDEELKRLEKQTKRRQCLHEECTRSRQFGYLSEWKPLVCSDHKDDLVTRENDPIVRCFKTYKCDAHNRGAKFGYKTCTHCHECREPDMKKLVNLCEIEGCELNPYYGFRDRETGKGKAIRCVEHKTPRMRQLNVELCSHCQLANATKTYNNEYCGDCYFYLHPDDKRSRNYRTKEQAFMIPLKTIHPAMVLDKTIEGGCSRRRPDGFIDAMTHVVIVEIDEGQHQGYDLTCENRRIVELFIDVAHRPIVFVRLNPDAYNKKGERFSGAFKLHNGSLKCIQEEFQRRFELLVEEVDKALTTVPEKTISQVLLCYNEKAQSICLMFTYCMYKETVSNEIMLHLCNCCFCELFMLIPNYPD